IDLAVYDAEQRPMLILLFCPGQVNTYRRESLAAARLFPGGPVPLVLITDTKEAMLVAVQKNEVLGEGMHAIPVWDWLERLVQEHPVLPLSSDRIAGERRILHTYSEFIKTCCDESLCML
ncbi:MAG: type I restriction endonuclease subunit R, partial [Halodesulfovibrio sp.]